MQRLDVNITLDHCVNIQNARVSAFPRKRFRSSLSAFWGYRITESSLGINQTKAYCKVNTQHRDQKRLAAIIHFGFEGSATLGKC